MKAVPATYNSIYVSWSAVDGATKYKIYRATTQTGIYTLLSESTALSYVNNGVKTGTMYYYKIKAYCLAGATQVYGDSSTDCVPASPDTSNMIPARLTGKPFWDLYLYQDPPIWAAYIDCVKRFGFDSLMDGYVPIQFEELGDIDHDWEEVIVGRTDERIYTQCMRRAGTLTEWAERVTVYYLADPPSYGIKPEAIGLPRIPGHWEKIEGRRAWPQGGELMKLVKGMLGEHGLFGVFCGTSNLLRNTEDIYDYYDNPGKYADERDRLVEYYLKRMDVLMAQEARPDFICTGGSGSLVFQSPAIFRELCLPIVQAVTRRAKEYRIPTHIHSCGPETALVKICAEETDLTVIDPLEVPPMGDCSLRELKELYGRKLILKGNLHTTNIMLRGSVQDVVDASKAAIDDASEGGRFILSTGDQCGRDTPDENIFAMIETARTYGMYR